MATQYSTLLKLALPTQGELSGSWGDVVNNNITSMIEEAVAGLKTIDTWSTNSATLSTADGTTAEARAAILNLTDTTSDLSGAATLICPALSKVYIVKNATGQAVTVKTASGSGVAIPNGTTGFVFCDGTNVVESLNNVTGNLTVGGNASVGGNLTVTGTTTFNGGTVTLGDANTDNIVFGGEIDSNIIPDDDGTYDLGSSSKEWKDIYIDGTAYVDAINFNGTAISATAAELNIMDGVTSTTTELNIVDGDTSASSVTVADADRVVLNDGGTMKQVAVTDLAAYFDDEITAMPNLVTTAATTVGALNSGSITSGFGTIDTGSSTITTTGLITGGSLDIDDVVINGTTIGHTDDTDLITVANGAVTVAGELSTTTLDIGGTNVTSTAEELNILDGVTATTTELNYSDIGSSVGTVVASKVVTADANKDVSSFRNITLTGELDAGSLDVSGDADIDGTLEADAITVNGTALSSVIAGTTVANATLAATTTVTDSNANTNFPVVFHDESNALLDDTGALRYNPSTGELLVPKLTVAGTTTTVDTVTMNAANAVVFEGATADDHETTLTIVDPTADRTISLPNVSGTLPVLAAVSTTQISATPEELNLIDGSSAGTIVNSKAVIYGSSGEVNATTLQIAGTSVTSTAAELNILDGVTSTATELNIMDGDTSASSTTLVDADRLVTNDNGTMKQVALSDVKTYLNTAGYVTDDPTALAIALG